MFWFVIAHHPVLADAPSADGAISAPTAGSTTVTEGWEWSMYESWQFLEAAGASEGFALPSGVKIFWNSDLLLQNDQGEVPSSCFLSIAQKCSAAASPRLFIAAAAIAADVLHAEAVLLAAPLPVAAPPPKPTAVADAAAAAALAPGQRT